MRMINEATTVVEEVEEGEIEEDGDAENQIHYTV